MDLMQCDFLNCDIKTVYSEVLELRVMLPWIRTMNSLISIAKLLFTKVSVTN